jgi:putative nucleotidyltransferase with HDIG domain
MITAGDIMLIIPVEKAQPGMVVGKNIFGANGQILLREGIILTDKYLMNLERMGIPYLYIKGGPDDIEVDDVINEKTRVAAMTMTRDAIEKIKIGAGFDAGKIKTVINNIIDDLLNNPNLVINLVDIRTHSDYIFAHSVNVAVLSSIVGIALGYDNKKLRSLTTGALFHDIGKVRVDQEILHKQQLLTSEEKSELQKHTQYGFDILRTHQEFNLSSAHVSFQHHEWYNGTGYPRGLNGENISELTRIVSITDTYDKLTGGTPYSRRYPVQEAIEYLMAGCDSQFDAGLVKVFLNCVAIYPVGVAVELNTGEKGIVVKVPRNFPTRPVVQITRNQFGVKLINCYEVDLLVKPSYFVTRIIEGFAGESEGEGGNDEN